MKNFYQNWSKVVNDESVDEEMRIGTLKAQTCLSH